jgi:predicted ATPase/class 3 adenylate cyclase
MPTQHRTLLLTDVVGSTELTRRLGDAEAGRWWATNDRIAREQLRRWHGREIDRTDGMLMLFEHSDDALQCALAYHEALAQAGAPFQARAGIHRGAVMLIENHVDDVAQGAKPLDVEGLALATVARVMSCAQGGQTLASAEALAGVPAPPESAPPRWRSHGHWRLGGLGEPSELFELVRPGFAAAPPQDQPKAYRVRREGGLWKPLREIAHNLPAERDSFVGRQQPLARLATLLDEGARLVTVTGMGGIGKTRLALRCAWSWLGEYPGGVWFCDLSPARDLAGVQRAVAHGLGVPLATADAGLQLARAIDGHGRCLLILDNFEQVAALAEATVGQWLDHAPQARFVVTSRERLALVGETLLELQPLPAAEAVALFERRAEAAGAAAPAESADGSSIARLVDMLDCLPLAIELAAARARVMSPRVLLSRMHERFALLASPQRRDSRHGALRAAIDWSWGLLAPAEQALLAQLSVFAGGFTLAACEQVFAPPATPDGRTAVDVLQSLLDRSLVRRVSEERFDLLRMVAAYSAERLAQQPEQARAAADRHACCFAQLGPEGAVANSCVELDNLIAACRHATACGDGDVAVAALAGTAAAINLRGPWQTLMDLADAVLAIPTLSPEHRLSALLDAAHACQYGGQVARAQQCVADIETLLPHVAELGLRARGLRMQADRALRQGDRARWRTLHDQALAAAEAGGHVELHCTLINRAGAVAELTGDPANACAAYEQGLTLARLHGVRRWEGGSAGNLGQLFANQGRFEEAGVMYEQAIAIARELGDRQWEANARCNLGLLHLSRGRPAQALPELVFAQAVARACGHLRLLGIVQCNLALVNDALGHLDESEALFQSALAVAVELDDRRCEGQFLGYLGWLLARRGRMAEARHALARGEALLEAANDRFSLGVHLAHAAMAEAHGGDSATGSAMVARAQAVLRESPSIGLQSELAQAIEQAQRLLAQRSRVPAP